jgi:hypothetical protein
LSSCLLSRNKKAKIYKTIILPVVLYGCETWSLKLREEYKLRVFENRVLWRIFGPMRDEVTGEWRSCTVKNFIIFIIPEYHWADEVKEDKVGGACGLHGRGEKSVQGFGGKA